MNMLARRSRAYPFKPRTPEELEKIRQRFKRELVERGKPRERLTIYALRSALLQFSPGFNVNRKRHKSKAHDPDVIIRFHGEPVAEVEVTGTDKLDLRAIEERGVRVLPSKLKYAEDHDPDRYIIVAWLDRELPYSLDKAILWQTGRVLLRELDRAHVYEGPTCHYHKERYWVFPIEVFRHGDWQGLIWYILWLAGLVADSNPWALANFML